MSLTQETELKGAAPAKRSIEDFVSNLSSTLLDNFTPSEQKSILNSVEERLRSHYINVINERKMQLEHANDNLNAFVEEMSLTKNQ